jgi:hypothetical protein
MFLRSARNFDQLGWPFHRIGRNGKIKIARANGKIVYKSVSDHEEKIGQRDSKLQATQ